MFTKDSPMTPEANPVPKKSLLLLALISAILFAPRIIEGTDTTCGAVSSQVVEMMMERVPAAEKVASTRQLFAGLIAPELVGKPWYSCSTLYWVNVVNPLPEIAKPPELASR